MPTANERPGRPAISAQTDSAAPVPTSGHGSEPASTPSITVFISVACGAGSSGEPNVNALPTVRIAARADGSRQPRKTKTTETPSSVTRVIAEVGFEETPIRPTMRDDTTTKQTPKIATAIAAISRGTS